MMSGEVYYFSGTGNSLAIARSLAQNLGWPLLRVRAIKPGQVPKDIHTLVVVFPVYLAQGYGVPLCVKEALESLIGHSNLRIIGIAICGGFRLVNGAYSLGNVEKLVKKHKLGRFDGYSIHMPMNNLSYPSPLVGTDQNKMFKKAKHVVEGIAYKILTKGFSLEYKIQGFVNFLLGPLYRLLHDIYAKHVYSMAQLPLDHTLTYFEAVKQTDRSIVLGDTCNGCGSCALVCPNHNITLQDGRPAFLHSCDMCMACDEWCPQGAIHHWCKQTRVRYHHPEVTFKHMIG